MTLTATDIKKIQDLYYKLDSLHHQRAEIKTATVKEISGETRTGTSGVSFCRFDEFTPEATKELKDVVARDLRRRAAKIVEALHKFGCEAKLTEE